MEAKATGTGAIGGAFGTFGGPAAPLTLLTYTGPVANAAATISLRQAVSATDDVQPGAYGKALTPTLSTATPCKMALTVTLGVGGVGGGPSSGTVSCPELEASGFFAPIDTAQTNIAKPGKTVPVKWRVTDAAGAPVTDPAHFVGISSVGDTCESGPTDAIEDYAGGSGLQNLGDGSWQFNRKTPSSYAGQWRTLVLTLSDGGTLTADFRFK